MTETITFLSRVETLGEFFTLVVNARTTIIHSIRIENAFSTAQTARDHPTRTFQS